MDSSFSSIVITGGRGMLAQAFERLLANRGLSVAILDRAACDITRAEDVGEMFRRLRPTLLLNCAAYTKVDLAEDEPGKADAINGHAVGTLATLAKEHGTTLVHFSTDFVFDGRATRPYKPDDPVNPLSAYGRSKLLGETMLQKGGLDRWLICRTAWLYGRGGACFPRTILERARAGQPLRVVSDQIGSPTHTADLAAATLDLIDRNLTGIWHLTNTGSVSWCDFAKATLEEFGIDADLSPVTTADWLALRPKQAIRPAYSVLDTSAFAQQTGGALKPWRGALREYVKEMRSDA